MNEGLLVPHPSGTDERNPEIGEGVVEFLRRQVTGVPPRARVHADQAVHPGGESLFRPVPAGDIMVDNSAHGMDAFDHPVRLPEGGDEKADPLLERDIDPILHPLQVDLRGFFDQRVETDRLVGEGSDEADPVPELVPVDEMHRDGLNHADAPRLRRRGYQFGVTAGIHRPAYERDFDSDLFRKRGFQRRHGARYTIPSTGFARS